jgi:hypothetical protein
MLIQSSRAATSQPPYPRDSEADADIDIFVPSASNRVDVAAVYTPRGEGRWDVEYFLTVPNGQESFRFFLVLNGDRAALRDFVVQGDLTLLSERRTRGVFGRTGRLQVFQGQYADEQSTGGFSGSTLTDACRRVEDGDEVTAFSTSGNFSLSGDSYESPFETGSAYWLVGKLPSMGLSSDVSPVELLPGDLASDMEGAVVPDMQRVCAVVSPPEDYAVEDSDEGFVAPSASPTTFRPSENARALSDIAPVARPRIAYRRSGWSEYATQQSLLAGLFLGIAASALLALVDSKLRRL